MSDDRYYVKIVPHKGDVIHRLVIRKRHVAVAVALLGICILAASAFAGVEIARAGQERAAIVRITSQTEALNRRLQSVQREDQEIGRLIGAPATAKPATPATQRPHKLSWTGPPNLRVLEAHVATLTSASTALLDQARRERELVLHVLNLRHIRELTQERLLAFIPSIDPVAGAEVVGCFCWRTWPDVEFHEGVDLGANYGDEVRAAAAGTIAGAGWEGGYGLKIDIDHGNGYHTWYAHLSRIDVRVGQRVYKGEEIAAVGATGFATGPHLHYQVMLNGRPIDPAPYLHGVPSSVLASLH